MFDTLQTHDTYQVLKLVREHETKPATPVLYTNQDILYLFLRHGYHDQRNLMRPVLKPKPKQHLTISLRP